MVWSIYFTPRLKFPPPTTPDPDNLLHFTVGFSILSLPNNAGREAHHDSIVIVTISNFRRRRVKQSPKSVHLHRDKTDAKLPSQWTLLSQGHKSTGEKELRDLCLHISHAGHWSGNRVHPQTMPVVVCLTMLIIMLNEGSNNAMCERD